MSRFGEPKPVERIKVLPQKTIKKVASKQTCSGAKSFILKRVKWTIPKNRI